MYRCRVQECRGNRPKPWIGGGGGALPSKWYQRLRAVRLGRKAVTCGHHQCRLGAHPRRGEQAPGLLPRRWLDGGAMAEVAAQAAKTVPMAARQGPAARQAPAPAVGSPLPAG
jgi:hypothetical protein